MQYVQLGERGPRVSRIAFGNRSAGGDWNGADGPADEGRGRRSPGAGSTGEAS